MKKIGILALAMALVLIFVTPIKDSINNLIVKKKGNAGENNAARNAHVYFAPIKGIQRNKNIDLKANGDDNKAEIQDKIMNYRLKSRYRIKQIQTALRKAGFYKGEIDGLAGPETRKATKAFQKSKGLSSDGIVGVRTWEKLKEYSTF